MHASAPSSGVHPRRPPARRSEDDRAVQGIPGPRRAKHRPETALQSAKEVVHGGRRCTRVYAGRARTPAVVAEGQSRRGGRDTDGCEREPSAHAATSLVGGRECASERRRRREKIGKAQKAEKHSSVSARNHTRSRGVSLESKGRKGATVEMTILEKGALKPPSSKRVSISKNKF